MTTLTVGYFWILDLREFLILEISVSSCSKVVLLVIFDLVCALTGKGYLNLFGNIPSWQISEVIMDYYMGFANFF